MGGAGGGWSEQGFIGECRLISTHNYIQIIFHLALFPKTLYHRLLPLNANKHQVSIKSVDRRASAPCDFAKRGCGRDVACFVQSFKREMTVYSLYARQRCLCECVRAFVASGGRKRRPVCAGAKKKKSIVFPLLTARLPLSPSLFHLLHNRPRSPHHPI